MNNPITVSNFGAKYNRKKLLVISLVVGTTVLIIIVAVFGFWRYSHNHLAARTAMSSTGGTCSASAKNAILPQAANALVMGDLKALGAITDQIKQSPGYAQDANCLYILTAYYLRSTNAAQAQLYLTKFDILYQKDLKVSTYLTNYMPVKTLQSEVASMVKAYRREQNNFYNMHPPK